MKVTPFPVVAALVFGGLFCGPADAQWLNHPTPGTPRLPDGRPNLSAPGPRTPDGKPEDVQPWAEALFLQRVRDARRESPLARCLPVSVPFHDFFNLVRIG